MSTDQALSDAQQHMLKRHGLRGAWFPIVVLVCFVMMGVALLVLTLVVRNLTATVNDRNGTVADLTVQVQLLQDQVNGDQALFAAKDARVRQLTDALIKAGVPVPAPAVTVIVPPIRPQQTPSPTPAPAPSPTRPSPEPTSTPSPSPSPTCTRLPVVGICRPAKR